MAPLAVEIAAPCDGWLARTDCRALGLALADMKGARRRVDDPLDLTCGIEFLPRIGERLTRGDVIGRVHCARPDEARVAAERVLAALTIGDEQPEPRPLVLERSG